MKVEMVDPRWGSTLTTNPRAQRIADAIVMAEWFWNDCADHYDVTVYELVHKYGLADILGSYSYTGRAPTNVADQVVRNALNDGVRRGDWVKTDDRRKGYSVYRIKRWY